MLGPEKVTFHRKEKRRARKIGYQLFLRHITNVTPDFKALFL